MEQLPSLRSRGSPAEEEEEEESLSPRWTEPDTNYRFCAVSLNIGGRSTNPMEFVLEGDESDVGTATAAFGVQMFEAMSSEGPSMLGAAERSAVDSVLAELAHDAESWDGAKDPAILLEQSTWARIYDLVTKSCRTLLKLLADLGFPCGSPLLAGHSRLSPKFDQH